MIASPVLILGARSDIGRALAKRYAANGSEVILAARGDMSADASDLALRTGAKVSSVSFDVTDGKADAFFESLRPVPGTVIMVVGLLGNQAEATSNDTMAGMVMETNYNGPSRYLLAAARHMAGVPDACIIGISSVAGDRGRASNFVYGSAKAGFTALLSGLRASNVATGIHVMTVKPGFVKTRMTAGMKLPSLLTTTPEKVAEVIIKAQSKNLDVVYISYIWNFIMKLIKILPEFFFKRLKF